MARYSRDRHTFEDSDGEASVEAAKEASSRTSPVLAKTTQDSRKTDRSPRAKKRGIDFGPTYEESDKNPDVSDERYADWVSELREVSDELRLWDDDTLESPNRKRKRSAGYSSDPSSVTATSPTSKASKCSRPPYPGPFPRSQYRLDFGKHRYKTLDEVPSGYIDWLISNEVHLNRPELAAALKSKGLLTATSDPEVSALRTWRMPHALDRYNDGFYDQFTNDARWISLGDAKKYFRVDANLLRTAKIQSLAGNTPRYPLYQVYSCADHFKTIANGNTQQALDAFQRKNERREREIMSEMFPGCDCYH